MWETAPPLLSLWPEAVLQAEVPHLLRPPQLLPAAAPAPGNTWKLPDRQRVFHPRSGPSNREVMDKLKKVLSGQDEGNTDGTGIMEVTSRWLVSWLAG